jgi:hypothetical protein
MKLVKKFQMIPEKVITAYKKKFRLNKLNKVTRKSKKGFWKEN